MKTVLLWDLRFPGRTPARLTLDDAIASVAVRCGAAAFVNQADYASLSGGAVAPGNMIEGVVQHGIGNRDIRRLYLPTAVFVAAAGLGLGASIDLPLPPAPVVPIVTLLPITPVNEGNTGATSITPQGVLSAPAPVGGLTIGYTFNPNTLNAADFTGGVVPAGTGTVSVPAGASTFNLPTVSINGDTDPETDESFVYAIVAGAGYTVGSPSSATGIVLNDDGSPAVITAVPAIAYNTGTNVLTLTPATVSGGTATHKVVYSGGVPLVDGSGNPIALVSGANDLSAHAAQLAGSTIYVVATASPGSVQAASSGLTVPAAGNMSIAAFPGASGSAWPGAGTPAGFTTNVGGTVTQDGVGAGSITMGSKLGTGGAGGSGGMTLGHDANSADHSFTVTVPASGTFGNGSFFIRKTVGSNVLSAITFGIANNASPPSTSVYGSLYSNNVQPTLFNAVNGAGGNTYNAGGANANFGVCNVPLLAAGDQLTFQIIGRTVQVIHTSLATGVTAAYKWWGTTNVGTKGYAADATGYILDPAIFSSYPALATGTEVGFGVSSNGANFKVGAPIWVSNLSSGFGATASSIAEPLASWTATGRGMNMKGTFTGANPVSADVILFDQFANALTSPLAASTPSGGAIDSLFTVPLGTAANGKAAAAHLRLKDSGGAVIARASIPITLASRIPLAARRNGRLPLGMNAGSGGYYYNWKDARWRDLLDCTQYGVQTTDKGTVILNRDSYFSSNNNTTYQMGANFFAPDGRPTGLMPPNATGVVDLAFMRPKDASQKGDYLLTLPRTLPVTLYNNDPPLGGTSHGLTFSAYNDDGVSTYRTYKLSFNGVSTVDYSTGVESGTDDSTTLRFNASDNPLQQIRNMITAGVPFSMRPLGDNVNDGARLAAAYAADLATRHYAVRRFMDARGINNVLDPFTLTADPAQTTWANNATGAIIGDWDLKMLVDDAVAAGADIYLNLKVNEGDDWVTGAANYLLGRTDFTGKVIVEPANELFTFPNTRRQLALEGFAAGYFAASGSAPTPPSGYSRSALRMLSTSSNPCNVPAGQTWAVGEYAFVTQSGMSARFVRVIQEAGAGTQVYANGSGSYALNSAYFTEFSGADEYNLGYRTAGVRLARQAGIFEGILGASRVVRCLTAGGQAQPSSLKIWLAYQPGPGAPKAFDRIVALGRAFYLGADLGLRAVNFVNATSVNYPSALKANTTGGATRVTLLNNALLDAAQQVILQLQIERDDWGKFLSDPAGLNFNVEGKAIYIGYEGGLESIIAGHISQGTLYGKISTTAGSNVVTITQLPSNHPTNTPMVIGHNIATDGTNGSSGVAGLPDGATITGLVGGTANTVGAQYSISGNATATSTGAFTSWSTADRLQFAVDWNNTLTSATAVATLTDFFKKVGEVMDYGIAYNEIASITGPYQPALLMRRYGFKWGDVGDTNSNAKMAGLMAALAS